MLSGLNGHGSEQRQGRLTAAGLGHVADDENLGMSGYLEGRLDLYPSVAVHLDAGQTRHFGGSHTSAPDHGRGFEPLATTEHDAVFPYVAHWCAEVDLHAH